MSPFINDIRNTPELTPFSGAISFRGLPWSHCCITDVLMVFEIPAGILIIESENAILSFGQTGQIDG